jgi:hAT family C-terminal dimerisation region
VFDALQADINEGKAAGKVWKVVLDGGIRWNSSYQMIIRALALREALDTYAFRLRLSTEALDQEVFENDYLSDNEWKTLTLISEHLEPLFRLTKDLEGNPDRFDPTSASHGALWELLPVFEDLLSHFETLETQAKAGQFNNHEGIQESITLAWGKTKEYYSKTDASIAWMAALVLHPRWKWQYFEQQWTGEDKRFVVAGKTALRKLWENDYKGEVVIRVEDRTPEPEPPKAFKATVLERLAPPLSGNTTTKAPRASSRKDQLALYLEEPLTDKPLLLYWLDKQAQWPQLAKMALDFLSIPAMSSECERVFSSCSMQTTPHSSRLTAELLWKQECLKNWQRRGFIEMMSAFSAIDLGKDF